MVGAEPIPNGDTFLEPPAAPPGQDSKSGSSPQSEQDSVKKPIKNKENLDLENERRDIKSGMSVK